MGPLKPDLVELIIGLVIFFAVFAALAMALLPRIDKILAAREEATTGALERAEVLESQARRVRAEYRAELDAARQEAARIRQAAHEEGVALLAAVRSEGHKAREDMVAAAAVRLEADRVLAEAELREHVLGLATELAGRIVGEPLTDVDRARAVADEFFAGAEADTGS
ncbi:MULTISPECIES: ATP synthase F0 subunit B [unclassified Streptomyces]|uniref:F0F1 ATP synthase subunit B family protein n=1 Tax=unclassified Streptomyces TaxID=2593676 RepID=UPI0005694518|nr:MULTISPECIES: ATP synthase F0 subunit B [unclassified Streptomyces]